MKLSLYFRWYPNALGFLAFIVIALLSMTVTVAAEPPVDDDGMMQRLFKLHTKLAKGGNLESVVRLGVMYERGEGVIKNREKARELYKYAADMGNKAAIELLSNFDSKKPDGTLERENAGINVPVPKSRFNEETAAADKQRELESRLKKEKEAATAARLELEDLRQSQQKEKEKQLKLKQEIEQIQQAQEQLARERAKAEEARIQLELASKKHFEELQKQTELSNQQQELAKKGPQEDPQTTTANKKFSSNPCNTPAAKFMSTCN